MGQWGFMQMIDESWFVAASSSPQRQILTRTMAVDHQILASIIYYIVEEK